MPLGFPGQYYDNETGNYYNYFRDYDPTTGRYIQSDPIGLKGGLNTYAYVNGNPLIFTDHKGTVGFSNLGHYMGGSGATVSYVFSDIDSSNISPSMFDAVKSQVGGGECCEPKEILIDTVQAFSTTGFFQKAGFGNLDFVLKGRLKINSDCSWCFDGKLGAIDNDYDFDTERQHRSAMGQASTYIGSMLPGTPYSMSFIGYRAIHQCGR
jgi:RHS repeat-associated protein